MRSVLASWLPSICVVALVIDLLRGLHCGVRNFLIYSKVSGVRMRQTNAKGVRLTRRSDGPGGVRLWPERFALTRHFSRSRRSPILGDVLCSAAAHLPAEIRNPDSAIPTTYGRARGCTNHFSWSP